MTENNQNPAIETSVPSGEITFDPQDFGASTPEVKPSEKVKIKYNGAEEEYTVEELIPLAQKGRNYDPLHEKNEKLKAEAQILADLAKENGFKTGQEYVENVRQKAKEAKISARVEALKAEGVPENYAKELAEKELATPTKAPDPSPFLELFNKFPETAEWKDLDAFPDEVRQAIQNGENPVVAYSVHKANLAQAERDKALAQQDARERSTGSLQSQSDGAPDPLLAGLFGK
jgi:hypothetical protein